MENKLAKAIIKMMEQNGLKLADLLSFDDKIKTTNFKGIDEFESSKLNDVILAAKGVDIKNDIGHCIRSGGRYRPKKGSGYDMKTW
jgi:hypothetical protein